MELLMYLAAAYIISKIFPGAITWVLVNGLILFILFTAVTVSVGFVSAVGESVGNYYSSVRETTPVKVFHSVFLIVAFFGLAYGLIFGTRPIDEKADAEG
jgi:hypothetical protein